MALSMHAYSPQAVRFERLRALLEYLVSAARYASKFTRKTTAVSAMLLSFDTRTAVSALTRNIFELQERSRGQRHTFYR